MYTSGHEIYVESRQAHVEPEKHGFDFLEAEQVFNGPTFTVEDARGYDGEQRFNSTGFLGAAIVTICHTETEDEIHIISMRKADPHEIDTLSNLASPNTDARMQFERADICDGESIAALLRTHRPRAASLCR